MEVGQPSAANQSLQLASVSSTSAPNCNSAGAEVAITSVTWQEAAYDQMTVSHEGLDRRDPQRRCPRFPLPCLPRLAVELVAEHVSKWEDTGWY